MYTKKGFQLAINMVVVIVLGIVLLGTGIYLVTTLVTTAEQQFTVVDDSLKEELRQSLFNDGQLVSMLNIKETVRQGKSTDFLLGMRNKDKDGRTLSFSIEVTYNAERSPVEVDSDFKTSNLYPYRNTMLSHQQTPTILELNEEAYLYLYFAADKKLPRGEYYYDITVKACPLSDGVVINDCIESYGGKQRIYITVI